MSYDIRMIDPVTKKTLYFSENHNFEGGTYIEGGTREAWVNITYNYSRFYRQHIDEKQGIRFIYGKKGREVIDILEKAVKELGIEKTKNYWDSSPGNAGAALLALIAFCNAFPFGVFEGD